MARTRAAAVAASGEFTGDDGIRQPAAEVHAWTIDPDLERAGGASLASLEVALDLVEHAWRTRREMLAEE